jgi:pyruvate,water dikinase
MHRRVGSMDDGLVRREEHEVTASTTHRYLLDLRDPACREPQLVGCKASSLADLLNEGFDVPDGTVLTIHAFNDAIGILALPTEEAVRGIRLPETVESALLHIANRFGEAPLAVRSSGVAEDLVDSSFAGLYETVLGVRGPEELIDAVRTVWASAFTDRIERYRQENDFADAPMMAVLVQRLVDADAAGVAFTADPITGAGDVVIVNAVPGLGDRLVSGEVTPEQWSFGIEGATQSPDREGVLSEEEAQAVAALARELESILGNPQDVEWALKDGRVWLLQTRPITGLTEVIEPVPVAVEVPEGYFERDASHFPAPHSPLGRSIVYPLSRHTTRFLSEFGMLADEVVLTDIGGWHYTRIVPLGGKDRKPPPASILGLLARVHPQMRQRISTSIEAVRTEKGRQVIDRWYDEWQPNLAERIDHLGNVDRNLLSDHELESQLAETVALLDDGLVSHIFVHAALMMENYRLAVACRELLGWDEHQMLEMLAGLSQRSTEPARELARLASMIEERPEIRRLLTDITDETVGRLVNADPEFFDAFDSYRWSASGFRALSRDVADPTLADQPALLLKLILNQIEAGFAPSALDIANEERRGELVAEALTNLTGLPDEHRRFEEALERATRAYPLREDNVFYAVQAPLGLIRYAALEMGDRMTERGQIGSPDDVFFLEYPELTSAFKTRDDQHELVERRKGERAWVLAHPGPPSYGTPPGPPPSLKFLPAEARYVTDAFFWGMGHALNKGEAQTRRGEGIIGVAASPGRYRGTVRVIMNESEFGKLQPGDVVVCPVTQPTWSILFPSIGAVVTDSGGILSHPAIIAREYRIPAVVATGNATSLLKDGEMVTVDGSTGMVTLLEPR